MKPQRRAKGTPLRPVGYAGQAEDTEISLDTDLHCFSISFGGLGLHRSASQLAARRRAFVHSNFVAFRRAEWTGKRGFFCWDLQRREI